MISIVKKKNKIKRELLSKIEWACSLNAIKLEHEMIFEGCLRIIEHTNLAYVEPHRVIIKDKLFLFFNECDYFYVGDLRYVFVNYKMVHFLLDKYNYLNVDKICKDLFNKLGER